jgi:hypothetical protein
MKTQQIVQTLEENVNARDVLANARSYLEISTGSTTELNEEFYRKYNELIKNYREAQFFEFLQSKSIGIKFTSKMLDDAIDMEEAHSHTGIVYIRNDLDQVHRLSSQEANELKEEFARLEANYLDIKISILAKLMQEFPSTGVLLSEEKIDEFLMTAYGCEEEDLHMPDDVVAATRSSGFAAVGGGAVGGGGAAIIADEPSAPAYTLPSLKEGGEASADTISVSEVMAITKRLDDDGMSFEDALRDALAKNLELKVWNPAVLLHAVQEQSAHTIDEQLEQVYQDYLEIIGAQPAGEL